MVSNRVITNKLDKLERSLKKKLLTFYNSKVKGSPIPIDILKQKYGQQIRDLIRKTVQDSYLVGTDTVGNEVLTKDQDFTLFISNTDLSNINQLTDRLSNDFWNTAQRLQDREAAVVAETGQPKSLFNAQAALTEIAAAVAFNAFNSAVKSKTTQVTSTPLQQTLDLEVGFEIRPVGKIRFTTKQDGKVDPDICMPLHGTEWFVDDPSIVTPPEMTHRFCRCTLVPVIE
jgi:hypothetical protein